MNEEEFAELAAGHSLHALSAEDERRYTEALRAHPEWDAVTLADAETVAGLADAVDPVTPDAGVRDALLARIAVTPQGAQEPIPASPATRARRPRLRLLFALAACLAVLVGLGVGAVALNNQINRPAPVVALAEIDAAADAEQASVPLDDGGTATVHWSAELGAAVLVAEGLDALDAEETYQLWFVRGETPLSAGLFETDAGEATALLDGEIHEDDVIAVTVEPSGGSPTGQPTSDPIFAIPTA